MGIKRARRSREWGRLSANERGIIERYAEQPPVRLVSIAGEFGAVVKATTLRAGISGSIEPEGGEGSFVIRVNRHDPEARQRFTVAHEIAHLLLHRDLIESGIVDTKLYRSKLTDKNEQQANRLASDILMPVDIFNKFFEEVESQPEQLVIRQLAARFKASEDAVRIKIGLGSYL